MTLCANVVIVRAGQKTFAFHTCNLTDHKKPLRIGIRQLTEKHTFKNSEDRRVRAQPQRQREYGNHSEAAIAQEMAESIAHVLHYCFQAVRPADLFYGFSRFVYFSEFHAQR